MRTQIFYILSVLIGICLNIVAIPESVESYRPEFMVLVIFYFTLYHEHQISFVHVFLTGILVDVITGSLLGQHPFVYLLINLCVHHFRSDWARSPLSKTILCVGFVSTLALLTTFGIETLFKESKMGLDYWHNILMTMSVWPIFYGFNQKTAYSSKRQFKF